MAICALVSDQARLCEIIDGLLDLLLIDFEVLSQFLLHFLARKHWPIDSRSVLSSNLKLGPSVGCAKSPRGVVQDWMGRRCSLEVRVL